MHPIRLIAADGAASIMQPSRSVILDGSCNANSLPTGRAYSAGSDFLQNGAKEGCAAVTDQSSEPLVDMRGGV